MWEVLSEANWELIGVVVALVGVVCSSILGAILYLLQRRRKELGYRVISHTRVVSVEAEVEEEVVISFRGEIVTDVHLVMVEVVNWGNQPIVPEDYESAVCLDLGFGCRVMSVEQVGSKPEGIDVGAFVVESRDKVEMRPVLLNRGDSISLKILVSGFAGTVDAEGRIVGVKEINLLVEEPGRVRAWTGCAAALVFMLTVMFAMVYGWFAGWTGWWLGAFFWWGTCLLLIIVWVRWAAPALNRYLRELRPASIRK